MYCCVPQCFSKYSKKNPVPISFYTFPKLPKMISKWLVAIRSRKKPTPFTRICSKHFKEIDYEVGYGNYNLVISYLLLKYHKRIVKKGTCF